MCYMRTVTHREMRNSSGEILRLVAAGERIQVTNNGVVAAVIGPPGGDQLDELIAKGQARPAVRPVSALGRVKRSHAGGVSSTELRDEIRGKW